MAEYITKEQVVEWFRPYAHTDEGIPFDVLVTDITGMPAADVAPVVRCKDCFWFAGRKCCPLAASGLTRNNKCLPTKNDFCSYGDKLAAAKVAK